MKQLPKLINTLIVLISILSTFACIVAITSNGGPGRYSFQSITGLTVPIYGVGLYQNDSVSVATQGLASDYVTLYFALPVLIVSWIFTMRDSFRGRLLLTGTVAYFLYTYMSYTFLWNYNELFLIYVALMSISLFAFIYLMISFDLNEIKNNFSNKLPVKLLGGFQIFISITISLLWLGKMQNSILGNGIPEGLDHYTTLVIQGMDLAFVAPAAFIAGVCLIQKKPLGYLLSSVIIFKSLTMLTSITAMIIGQKFFAHVEVALPELIVFTLFDIFAAICLIILIKGIKKTKT